MKRSLNVLSETIDQTYPHLSAALDGVARFSDTIGKRRTDQELLANANKIAGVLGNRSEKINALVNAQTLLGAINERSHAVSVLLENVDQFSAQVTGFINDNPNLNHVLEQLRTISDILKERKFDLVDVLSTLAKFTASLAEAVASGPVQGAAGQPAAAVAAAAVRRRRVQEARHRPRGVLAQRRPARLAVPRPERHAVPERCSRAGTDPLEGASGASAASPAIRARTPHGGTLPRPNDPLPCSHLSTGPFGPNPYSNRPARATPARRVTSPPNPTALASHPACPPRPSRVSCRRTYGRACTAPARSARCAHCARGPVPPEGRTSRRASRPAACARRTTAAARTRSRAGPAEPHRCRATRRTFHPARKVRAGQCRLSSTCET